MSQIYNHIRLTEEMAIPAVGMGATYFGYTDRDAYTILSISKSGKGFTMQEDTATRTDTNGMSESQDYTFTPNPRGRVVTVKMTKNGWRVGGMRGHKVAVGVRDSYYDYSF
jgi:hypothetical protein